MKEPEKLNDMKKVLQTKALAPASSLISLKKSPKISPNDGMDPIEQI